MDSDDDLIAARREHDERKFLINCLDVEISPRNGPALLAARALLVAGGWWRWNAVVAAGLRDSDIAVKTMDNLVRRLVAVGMLERRGEYLAGTRRKAAVDTRELRLADWPMPEKKPVDNLTS